MFLSQGKSKPPPNSVLLRALSGTRWLPRSGCQSPEGDVCPHAGRQAWLRPGTKHGSDLPLRSSGRPSSNPHTRPKISIWALGLEDWSAGQGLGQRHRAPAPAGRVPLEPRQPGRPSLQAVQTSLPGLRRRHFIQTFKRTNLQTDPPRPY